MNHVIRLLAVAVGLLTSLNGTDKENHHSAPAHTSGAQNQSATP